jgi:hypothetical protein
MARRIGKVETAASYFVKLWVAAVAAAAVAWAIRIGLHPQRPIIGAVLILVPYAAVYLGLTAMAGIGETASLMKRLSRARR